MTRRTDKEKLLADVLGEEADSGFQEALLDETLRLVRRRRQTRQARQVGGVLTLVVAIAAIAIGRIPRAPVTISQPPAKNYELTLSQPLLAASIVSTRSLATDQLVSSTAMANVVRTTMANGNYHEVGDDELLALAPQPAALVRRGPQAAELVFVNPPGEADEPQN